VYDVRRMFRVLTLNKIAPQGLARLPADRYVVSNDERQPDAILVRSTKMHDLELPASLKAVGRAGTGVNNIPVAKLSARGIPVFNTPGANANAVKELVIAGLVLGCRRICQAWAYARTLEGSDEEISKAVEAGKGQFVGHELPGRTLGVVGLGAIGRLVANTAVSLGMNVIGYDPGLTVEGAWQLSSQVHRAATLEDLLRASQFVTLHVPLMDATRQLLNAARLPLLPDHAIVLNFAREAIVDEAAIVDALDTGKLAAYLCDFPSNRTKAHPHVVALPHLGASTLEAEDNCAAAVVDQIRDFLEHGNLCNTVNFPDVVVSRGTPFRLVCANANVPNMLSQVSDALGQAGLNIHDMVNRSRGELAYTVVDLDAAVPDGVVQHIAAIPGVLMARTIK
jgi:D-3-phosphoglycerate dehydrogenase / 2-oxoglutarate reductase